MPGLPVMLTLVVVDAELELVPPEMLDDYSIRIQAKKRKKPAKRMILDSNFMHGAIERAFPGESTRRGRPDIIFHLLQVALESILSKRGQLAVIIHTRNDIIISVNPRTRLPKSYNRFVGLMEDLFEKGIISGQDEVLLKTEAGDWKHAISLGSGQRILLSPRGVNTGIREIFRSGPGEDRTVVIGGFSQGDFLSDVYSLGSGISIFPEELTIWSVAMEAICQYERDFNIL
jgi:Uncharacterized conserved protein, COG1756